jgi:hypothetical protein
MREIWQALAQLRRRSTTAALGERGYTFAHARQPKLRFFYPELDES